MISFKPLTEGSVSELLSRIESSLSDADISYARECLDMLSADSEEREYGICLCCGCLLARAFDGFYYFTYPIPLCDEADCLAAVDEIRAYAVKEEIALVLSDIPREEIGGLLSLFRHINLDSEDEDNQCFTLRALSEAAMLDELPTVVGGAVELMPLTPEDDEIYARLAKDRQTNKYWGYDFSLDNPDPSDSDFRATAEEEFARGVAICLAVRVEGAFAGEAILYGFDLLGGCECAVRLLPAFRRKGYATEALRGLKTLARRIGLVYLCASVSVENKPSIKMTEKVLDALSDDGEILKFKSFL